MRRAIRSLISVLISLLLLAPILGLSASWLGPTPDSGLRLDLFSLALSVFDPATHEALGNSLLAAALVALLGMILGLSLALLARRSLWAGRFLDTLSAISALSPPVVLALGFLACTSALSGPHHAPPAWLRILAWIGVELSWSLGLVCLACRHALNQLPPLWEDAARLSGGSPWLSWRVLFRPLVMPSVVRAGAFVFTWTLFEPAAPWLLGLRRTLPSRLLLSASEPPIALPSTAALALLGLASAALVRSALLLWAGRPPQPFEPAPLPPPPLRPRHLQLRAWLAPLPVLVLLFVPLAGLLHASLLALHADPPSAIPHHLRLLAQSFQPALVDSAILGASAASLSFLAALLTLAWSPNSWRPRLLLRLPPLALAVGALGLVWLLDRLGAHRLALALNPYASPGTLLVLLVAILQVPLWRHVLLSSAAFSRPSERDAARLLGGPRSLALRFRTLVWPAVGPPLIRTWLASALLAAFETSSALLLTPSSAFRPLGPSLLDHARASQNLPSASLLALISWLLLLLLALLTLRPRHPATRAFLLPSQPLSPNS